MENPELNGGLYLGKQIINGGCSSAMFDYRRVSGIYSGCIMTYHDVSMVISGR